MVSISLLAALIAQVQLSDPQFVAETIHTGDGMISIDFGPNNRLYVAQKQGRILTLESDGSGGYLPATDVADLSANIDAAQESGLLGMIVDPDFATTRQMYLLYTTLTDQRITRIDLNATFDQMVAGSEVTILSGFPRNVNFHKAGDLQFRPNEPDHLYVTLGDDGRAAFAQDLTVYNGKILRISKVDGTGLLDNPFQNGDPLAIESRIWAIGLRNPFRFVFHPTVPNPDVVYISENGNSTDRIAWVLRGSNGSWSTAGDSGGFLSPPDTNFRVMTTDSPFLVGIAIAHGGHFEDPANPGSDVVYVANGFRQEVNRWRLSGTDLDTLNPLAIDAGGPFLSGAMAADLVFGPDGALYLTSTQNGDSLGNYVLRRVRFVAGTPPVAAFTTTPNPPRGNIPLTIQFNDASTDADGSISSWQWNFGDNTGSTQQNPSHTYNNQGTFQVSLTVVDNSGLPTTVRTPVIAEHNTSIHFLGQLYDGRTLPASNLPIATQLRLYREDGTTPIAFTGGLGPMGNGIAIASGGAIDATIAVELSAQEVVVSAGEGSGGLQAAYFGFVVPANVATHEQTVNLSLSTTALRGRIRDTRGVAATVDLGVSRAAQGALYAFAGARDYAPGSGIPASGTNHRTTSDVLGLYYVPINGADAGVNFYVDIVGDTGAMVYLSSSFDRLVAADAAVIVDVTLGLQQGGAACDDLTTYPEVPRIDYATMIQPLWSASCTGCHNAGSGNNGGLNLETDSYAHLMAMSLEVPSLHLVEPGEVGRSFLFEKINCSSPQIGTRMRPADPMRTEEQALIANWIAQGALEVPVPLPEEDGGVTEPDAGVDGGVIPDPPDSGQVASMDAGGMDGGRPDAGGGGGGPIAERPDKTELRGTCGCNTTSDRAPLSASWALLLIAGMVLARRARRRRL